MADRGRALAYGAPFGQPELPNGPITAQAVAFATTHCGSEVRKFVLEDCTLIAECSDCRELFRSLPAFAKHKRNHCLATGSEECTYRSDNKSMWYDKTTVSGATTLIQELSNTGSDSRLHHATFEQSRHVDADSDFSVVSLGRNDGTGEQGASAEAGEALGNTYFVSTVYEGWQPPRGGSPCSSPSLPEPGGALHAAARHAAHERQRLAAAAADSDDDDDGGANLEEVADDKREEQAKCFGRTRVARDSSGHAHSTVAGSALKRCTHWDGMYAETSCIVCSISFSSLDQLREHMVTHHPKGDVFYQCPDCSKVFSQKWSAKRHLSNFHRKSKEEMHQLRGQLKKPARRTATSVPPSPDDGGLATCSFVIADDDDGGGDGEHELLPAEFASAASKKKRLDLHVCSMCSKVLGSSQLMLKHREHCGGCASPAHAATAPGSADLATSGGSSSAGFFTDSLSAQLPELAGSGRPGSGGGGCSAAAADALLMLSQASLPSGVALGARRSRRQPKPNRLFIDKSDGEGDDDDDEPPSSRQPSGEHLNELSGEVADVAPGARPACIETDPRSAAAEGRKNTKSNAKSKSRLNSRELEEVVDFSTLSCKLCKKQLSTNFNLRRHAKRHLRPKQYQCGLCTFKSHDKSDCSNHVQNCHNKSEFVPKFAFVIDLGEEPAVASRAAGDSPAAANGPLGASRDSLPVGAAGAATSPSSLPGSSRSNLANLGDDYPRGHDDLGASPAGM